MHADIKCPKCGSEMVVRTAKKGPNAGRKFYVCSNHPECKGKVAIREKADLTRFHLFAGQQLASLLPYRKRYLIFGTKVCEYPAVMPMTTAAFFLGCSLGLSNKSAAEEILTEAAALQPWRTAFSEIIHDLERRVQSVNVATAMFEGVFPEYKLNRYKHVLLTPLESVFSIAQRVLMGLIYAVLSSEMSLSMLKAWVSQERGWKDLGVGGLRVDSTPLLTSVEEACERAQSMYEIWQSEWEKGG